MHLSILGELPPPKKEKKEEKHKIAEIFKQFAICIRGTIANKYTFAELEAMALEQAIRVNRIKEEMLDAGKNRLYRSISRLTRRVNRYRRKRSILRNERKRMRRLKSSVL